MRKKLGKIKSLKKAREYRRRLSIRKKVFGSEEMPRICFNKTSRNLRIQVIDDIQGKTLFSLQTFGKNAVVKGGPNQKTAESLGELVGKKLLENKKQRAVFDRSGKTYIGVVKVFTEALRKTGVSI